MKKKKSLSKEEFILYMKKQKEVKDHHNSDEIDWSKIKEENETKTKFRW